MHPIKRKFILAVFVIAESFFVFSFGISPAHAEIRHQGSVLQDTVWSPEDNPHLLESDVMVPDDMTLSILPGTVISIAPEADTGDIGFSPALYINGGTLLAHGSVSNRISIDGVSGVFVSSGQSKNGTTEISYADLTGGSGISFDNSYGTIATSTIKGANMGIWAKDSQVSVWGSQIEDNETGVYLEPHQTFQVRRSSGSGTGGEGNVFAFAPAIHASSSFTISNSIIRGNSDRAVSNYSEYIADAAQNWWGSAEGPTQDGANSIQGGVEYTPWLAVAPDLNEDPAPQLPCCSSILFVPGLEGTRLFSGTNQLWEPNRNADVVKLWLNAHGSSTDKTIYSGGPITKALGVMSIYGKFMSFLDTLVQGGKVNEWRAFGYDWRKSIPEVVAGAEKKATTTENLIAVVEGLASRSRTGKVSIVAHSNGGLVAKYLVKTLVEQGKEKLIDTIISVAVPYLGTPAAIPALLYGDGQSILGGLVASRANMRNLGINMPSAYSLLPSSEFFMRALSPSIAFASTTNGTTSIHEQSSFMAGKGGNKLLQGLADLVHDTLDPWVWPSKIASWAIAGWNKDTVNTLRYSGSRHASIDTAAGDGTVVAPSAYGAGGKVVSIDLKAQSRLDEADISHVNILESSTTEAAISHIVTNPADNNTKVIEEISKLPGVTMGEIDWRKMMRDEDLNRKEVRVSTHSPVKLHVYDSHGNHTGEIPLPAEIMNYDAGDSDGPGVEEGLYSMKEEKIPGSSYSVLECHDDKSIDCDTEIVLPDSGETYTAVVEGASTGVFTLDIDRVRATSTVETVEWSGVPVTALSVATTTFTSNPAFVVPRAALASSTMPLRLDIDGNGTIESTMKPGKVKDSSARLDLLRKHLGMLSNRHGHRRFRDFKAAEARLIKEGVEAFLRRFGRS